MIIPDHTTTVTDGGRKRRVTVPAASDGYCSAEGPGCIPVAQYPLRAVAKAVREGGKAAVTPLPDSVARTVAPASLSMLAALVREYTDSIGPDGHVPASVRKGWYCLFDRFNLDLTHVARCLAHDPVVGTDAIGPPERLMVEDLKPGDRFRDQKCEAGFGLLTVRRILHLDVVPMMYLQRDDDLSETTFHPFQPVNRYSDGTIDLPDNWDRRDRLDYSTALAAWRKRHGLAADRDTNRDRLRAWVAGHPHLILAEHPEP